MQFARVSASGQIPAIANVRIWDRQADHRMSEIMKDFGRREAYANPSNAGTRVPQAVGYGFFGFLPLSDVREATHGG